MSEQTNPFRIAEARLPGFCGRRLSYDDWEVLREIVESCGLPRWELAATICEALGWTRPNGNLKTRECFEFLASLDSLGVVRLPAVRSTGPRGRTQIARTTAGEERPVVECSLADLGAIALGLVRDADERALWRELVERHHYLGHRVPYGARLRYLVWVSERGDPGGAGRERAARQGPKDLVGCLQFSSPAWKLEARDRWLGWDDATRRANLQMIVNNSRFLIVPWLRVKGLASHVLSLALRVVADDWEEAYAVRPVLVETFVEKQRHLGTCYKAANWIELGETAGRGRMDRRVRRDKPVKTCLVYPLSSDYRRRLGVGAP